MFAYILVDVSAGIPRHLEEKIARMSGVIEARSVYGGHYDLVVRVNVKERTDITEITDKIQSLGDGILTITLEAGEES